MRRIIKKIIPSFLLSFYHYTLSFVGAVLYGFPSKKMIVVGITGTSGKSTVVELASAIFKEAGLKVASISSIRFIINEKKYENKLKMTMPGRMKIQKFLKKALKSGCKYVIMEVTSEGIKQYRHRFINFNTAVFTNLSPEHIESHGSFEKYKEAKLRLFRHVKNIHIINIDDENANSFMEITANKKIEYGIKDANLLPEHFNLLAKFNLYNGIVATKIALSQGISLDVCQKALSKTKGMPGRMEIVNKEPLVIVDYAHTPTQLEKVYQSLKDKRMICVLGSCGGGRDKWKRPVMGKIAQQYCDKVIITNEDPYDEDPMEIIDQVVGKTNAEKIIDRKEAIKKALSLANNNDVVIITGKGSEPWMCVANNKKIPWDDREIIREEIKK